MEIPAEKSITRLAFYFGLSLICASTLMYEVVLTRLLSVLCWYYLAFVSISMAMFGMTAGALVVQLRPGWFKPSDISCRLARAAFAMAVSMRSAWIAEAPWSAAIFVAAASCPLRVPMVSNLMPCLLAYCALPASDA